eukprot:12241986-Prorocentrum_lima.AAC.1
MRLLDAPRAFCLARGSDHLREKALYAFTVRLFHEHTFGVHPLRPDFKHSGVWDPMRDTWRRGSEFCSNCTFFHCR